jgi:Ser/Thr protein kinase RdoA (MazF antagonist)
MPKQRPSFSPDELVYILSHYSIGIIHKLEPLQAGNLNTPKVVISSEKGRFLLKRRPKATSKPERIALSHSVQRRLYKKALPVSALVRSRHRHTAVWLDDFVYELFVYVTGTRYDGSEQATLDTGTQLARFHQALSAFKQKPVSSAVSFHDAKGVRRNLKTIGAKDSGPSSRKVKHVTDQLQVLYNSSSVRVNELGFDTWHRQIIHGDWHPGNMLFADQRLVAMLDFDSIRLAPAMIDLANGLLQFSIVAGHPDPGQWPDHIDEAKLMQFLQGYSMIARPDNAKLEALPDLMVETMIAEAVLPIAATGSFGHMSGLDFLQMILRKAYWLNEHRRILIKALTAVSSSPPGGSQGQAVKHLKTAS